MIPGPRDLWRIDFSWDKAPLNLNDRTHWAVKASKTRLVVADTRWLVRAARIPHLAGCTVQMHFEPADARRRDTDNLVATLKPICDAIVLEGVVPDDTPVFMSKPEPIIHASSPRPKTYPRRPLFWIEIRRGLL